MKEKPQILDKIIHFWSKCNRGLKINKNLKILFFKMSKIKSESFRSEGTQKRMSGVRNISDEVFPGIIIGGK